MTTENKLNEEIVDQTPIENNENNTDALDASIEERVEEISKEEQLSQDLASEKDKFLRLFAEFENYKRRTARERIELFKTANQDVLLALLPVLDLTSATNSLEGLKAGIKCSGISTAIFRLMFRPIFAALFLVMKLPKPRM